MFKISNQRFELTHKVLAFLIAKQSEAGGAWAIPPCEKQPSMEVSGHKVLGDLHPSLSRNVWTYWMDVGRVEANINEMMVDGIVSLSTFTAYLACNGNEAIAYSAPVSNLLTVAGNGPEK